MVLAPGSLSYNVSLRGGVWRIYIFKSSALDSLNYGSVFTSGGLSLDNLSRHIKLKDNFNLAGLEIFGVKNKRLMTRCRGTCRAAWHLEINLSALLMFYEVRRHAWIPKIVTKNE